MKTRVAALALAALAGCVQNNASVEFFGICLPPDDAEVCGTSASCEVYLTSPRPWVYTSIGGETNELWLFVEMRNQTPNNEDASSGRVNNNDFDVDAYELSFEVFSETAAPLAVSLPDAVALANVTIPANGSMVPVIPVLPRGTMASLRAFAPPRTIVEVEVVARGTLGSGPYETAPWKVAVDVVNADFGGFGCVKPDEIVVAVCPKDGQTASVACETIQAPAPAP